MRVIFDTNIWVSFLIGKRLSLSQAFFKNPDIELYYCEELEREFLDVTRRIKIKKYVDENQIERVHQLIMLSCHKCKRLMTVDTSIRDPKDLYLLSLAETVEANYIVTGDTDLLDLKQYQLTRIITFAEFKELLKY